MMINPKIMRPLLTKWIKASNVWPPPRKVKIRWPLVWEKGSKAGYLLPRREVRMKTVRGNPYISVNKATMKAVKTPIDLHSNFPLGARKLRAKKRKKRALAITAPHIP
jgi:hypothetical protein